MIITCPNCTTDYSVNADVFPVTGRTVKCARCAQTWYALPSEEQSAEAPADDPFAQETGNVAASAAPAGEYGAGDAAEDDMAGWPGTDEELAGWDAEPEDAPDGAEGPGPDIDEAISNLPAEIAADIDIDLAETDTEEPVMTAHDVFGPTGEGDDFSGPDIEAEAAEAEAEQASIVDDGDDVAAGAVPEAPEAENIVPIEAASRARRAAMRFKTRLRKNEPVSAVRRAKSIAVGGMVAMLAAGIIYREDVVRSVPSMAGLYALAGFEINLRGLAFEALEPIQGMEQGIPVLRVKGGIRNVTQEAIEIPPVRLSLTSSSGQEIYFWTIQPETRVLQPGAVAGFSSVLSAPPRAAAGIAARFVDPDGVRIGLNG